MLAPLLTAILLAACAPSPPRGSPAGAPGDTPTPAVARVLTIGIQREPTILVFGVRADTSRGGGIPHTWHIAHDYLTVVNHRGEWLPQLAVEMPSSERGTWQLRPDGSMQTTWRIRPGVKWHDGVPLTADDLLFTLRLFKDPEIPTREEPATYLMASATAPDPQTLVVEWSGPYARATSDPLLALTPLPRHLLQGVYEASKADLVNHSYFTTDFVGVGPYRLARWERGAQLEFARFDDYYRGTPPLSRVVLRFINDASSMVAAILAGEIDVSLHREVAPEAALEVQRRWEGTGNQVLFSVSDRIEYLLPQLRPEFAEPRGALVQRAVRQAFYQAIDRDTLNQVITHGLAPPADSWVAPGLAARSRLEAAIPQFPYAPQRAAVLLAEAGWVPGPDGVLSHLASGDRLEVELYATPAADIERKLNIVADNWKAVGVQARLVLLPPARWEDSEYRAKLPGVDYRARGSDGFTERYLHSRSIASPANRWTGQNASGYTNPVVDSLVDRLAVTIAPDQRDALERELLREVMTDVAIMPLLWRVDPYLALKSVKGLLGSPVLEATWNMFDWNKE